ncbi:MAG: hypothetical protein MJZ50_08355 [Treponema sp.]|nr:hypothetical protein [Treponema sp.]
MKDKLKRPDYKKMYQILIMRMGRNFNRYIFILLGFHIIDSLLASFCIFPLSVDLKERGISVVSFAFSAILLFLGCIVSVQLALGLIKSISRALKGESFVAADLFYAFTTKKETKPLRTAVFFAFLFLIAEGIAAAVVFFNLDFFGSLDLSEFLPAQLLETEGMERAFSIGLSFIGLFLLFCILVVLPFVFMFCEASDFRNNSVFDSAKKCVGVMSGCFFHFIGFYFFIAIKNILIIAICISVQMRFGGSESTIAGIFSSILGFIAFLHEYTLVLKFYVSIPVYWYSILGMNGMLNGPSESTGTNESSAE